MQIYADVLRYRELFVNLFQRELRAKYKGSLLGVGWTLAYPLLLMGVYTVVFSVLWRAVEIEHYPLFLLCGLMGWVFFSSSLQSASRSLLANANLVKKVRFPRQLVPLAVVGSQLVTLLVMLVALLPPLLVLRPESRDSFWAGILAILALVALTSGLALAVASLNVRFRDVEHIVSSLLLPWFFLTPILYTFEALPQAIEQHELLVELLRYANVMAPVIEAIRDPLFFGRLPELADALYAGLAGAAALVVGALVFRRLDDELAVGL